MGDVRQLQEEHAAAMAKTSAQEPSIQAVTSQATATSSASGKNVDILELPAVTLTCEKGELVIQGMCQTSIYFTSLTLSLLHHTHTSSFFGLDISSSS